MHLRLALFPLLLCLISPAIAIPERTVVDGVAYEVLRTVPSSLRILWKDITGTQLRTFATVARSLQSNGITADTLVNGGIFESGGIPCGLLIQDGKQLHPVNRNDGDGNFFLKPNGILVIGARTAAIIRTEEYPLIGISAQYAVQSGPLLLRNGEIHPQLSAGSASRLHRNGVGISQSGEVILVITAPDSLKLPNLYEFAQLFRSLGCEDALFLDGIISQMRSGAEIKMPSNSFGSIIAVTSPGKQPEPSDGPAAQRPGDSPSDHPPHEKPLPPP